MSPCSRASTSSPTRGWSEPLSTSTSSTSAGSVYGSSPALPAGRMYDLGDVERRFAAWAEQQVLGVAQRQGAAACSSRRISQPAGTSSIRSATSQVDTARIR